MTLLQAENAFRLLLPVIASVFVLREFVTYKNWIPLKYLLTPLITILNISFVIISLCGYGVNQYRALVLLALVLSLAADVLLMIVEVKLLIYGIVYFLTAHIIYIFAFSRGYEYDPWQLIPGAILALVILVFDFKVGKAAGRYRPALIAYSIALGGVAFFSFSHLSGNYSMPDTARAAGGFLFVISDLFFGVNAFRKKMAHSSVITWSTYGPAQFLFAISCF